MTIECSSCGGTGSRGHSGCADCLGTGRVPDVYGPLTPALPYSQYDPKNFVHLHSPPSPQPPVETKLEPRKSLSTVAAHLNYAHRVIQCDIDEVESAITEEDCGHPNVLILANIMLHLEKAQNELKAAIALFPKASDAS